MLERASAMNSIGFLSAVSEVRYGADGAVQDRSRTEYFYNAAGERVREDDHGWGGQRRGAVPWLDAMGQTLSARVVKNGHYAMI